MQIDNKQKFAFALLFSGCLSFSACNSVEPQQQAALNLEAEASIQTRNMEDKGTESTYANLFLDPFIAIDDHANHTTANIEKDIPTLAKYLKEGTKTDLERARSIYVWLTKNISYDAAGYNNTSYGDASAEGVLKGRIAVCEGFSNLYQALGKEMGLEIEKVVGYAKGYGFARTGSFKQTNHAWNRIKINGEWRIFDATWGEGYAENIGGKIACTKSFDNYWFNVDPYRAIFDHYPQDPTLTGISPQLSLEDYKTLPDVNKNYFRIGFDAKKTYQTVLAKKEAAFPKCYDVKTPVVILDAPTQKALVAGQKYTFKMVIPSALKVALLDEHTNWVYMKEDSNGAWTISYTPTDAGKINILLNDGSKGASFNVLMSYEVVKADANYKNLNS